MGAIICKHPYLRRECDDSKPCMSFGAIGMDWFDVNRKVVMYTCATLSFVAIVLQIIPVMALSTKSGMVEDTNWTYGNGDQGVDVYVGLKMLVVENNDHTESVKWTDADCSSHYCDQCKAACERSTNVAIIALLTSIPQVSTDIVRAVHDSDLNCQKIMGVLTGFLGTVGVLAALGVYLDGCYYNLPDSIDIGGYTDLDMEWSLGPGFICLVAATCVRPVNFVAHLLTPTPIHKRVNDNNNMDEHLLPQA